MLTISKRICVTPTSFIRTMMPKRVVTCQARVSKREKLQKLYDMTDDEIRAEKMREFEKAFPEFHRKITDEQIVNLMLYLDETCNPPNNERKKEFMRKNVMKVIFNENVSDEVTELLLEFLKEKNVV